jgi:hypothetical protein
MSQPADVLFRIWIFTKPQTYDTILYRTFDAAARACTMEEGEIEEWAAVEGSPRLVLVATWIRTRGDFVMQLGVD